MNYFNLAKFICYGKNWCNSCKQEFVPKDPEEELCPACKIDEAEYRLGESQVFLWTHKGT